MTVLVLTVRVISSGVAGIILDALYDAERVACVGRTVVLRPESLEFETEVDIDDLERLLTELMDGLEGTVEPRRDDEAEMPVTTGNVAEGVSKAGIDMVCESEILGKWEGMTCDALCIGVKLLTEEGMMKELVITLVV